MAAFREHMVVFDEAGGQRGNVGGGTVTNQVVNVAAVRHRSLFRYPGGKTWLVPYARKWLQSRQVMPLEFAEPFAGGAIVGLSMLFDRLASRLTLVELDDNVAAVWRTLLNGKGKLLGERIAEFSVSRQAVRGVLDGKPRNMFDRAFATIIRNRMQRGGIMAQGASLMKDGENGNGLHSRWYPETLRQRILEIVAIKEQIKFIHGDGIAFLEANAHRTDIACLIDPPYTVAGRRLYTHSEIDHGALFALAARLKGDFLMTYDNVEPVRRLATNHGFDIREVAMKNTHHAVMSELLIGRDLGWVSASSLNQPPRAD